MKKRKLLGVEEENGAALTSLMVTALEKSFVIQHGDGTLMNLTPSRGTSVFCCPLNSTNSVQRSIISLYSARTKEAWLTVLVTFLLL